MNQNKEIRYHSISCGKPSANASVKNSQKSHKNNNIFKKYSKSDLYFQGKACKF